MIADFKYLQAASLEKLTIAIKADLREGWEPIGSLSIDRKATSFPGNTGQYQDELFIQSMIKRGTVEAAPQAPPVVKKKKTKATATARH